VARGLLGFGEGAAFPAGLKTVTETLPEERRSFGLGLAYSGGSLGALLTPIVIVPLAERWGWRAAFWMSAVVGFAWIGGWWWLRAAGLYRARTAEPVAAIVQIAVGRSRWNRDLFATAAIYGLGAAPLAFGLNWAAQYLTRVLHQPTSALGHWLWIPPAGWEAGYLFWGRVADRRRKQAIEAGVRPLSPFGIFAGFAAGSLALGFIPAAAGMSQALPITMAIFFLVMFFSGGYVVIALAHGATTQTAKNTGLLAGFSIAGWSLTTGVLMWVVGRMFDRAEYAASFALVAVLPLMGVVVWRLLSTPEAARELAQGAKV